MARLSATLVASMLAFATLPATAIAEAPAVLLDQGWTPAQRDLYHFTSQGTFLLPAVFLQALEDGAGGKFMDQCNMLRLGAAYDDGNSAQNPYGWPIGFTVDAGPNPANVPQAGLTCAACHSGQLRYKGQRIRIEGGQSTIDLNAFAAQLSEQILATGKDDDRKKRFINRALLLGYPAARVETDFAGLYDATLLSAERYGAIAAASTQTGHGRLDAVNDIANSVFARGLNDPANAKPGDAPTSFPYLWDIWNFDWVQYNASARQPMARNMVEALGTGHIGIVDPITDRLAPEDKRWKTSIRVKSLYDIETTLQALKPPPWPEEFLGRIDQKRYSDGKALFAENCSACHAVQRIEGTREWHVPVIPLRKIGTDPNQAVNFAGRRYDATKIGGSARTSISDGLYAVVTAVKRQAYEEDRIPEEEWARYDGFGRENEPSPSPCGYRARPLIGVWATAPFLHNGSVPTIHDLLSERRPETFRVGGNDIDPVKLGLSAEADDGAIIVDTRLPGNSNEGHWFTNDASRAGKIGRALSNGERAALIEYLKGVTPDDYPVRTVGEPSPLPCTDNPDWALTWPDMAKP